MEVVAETAARELRKRLTVPSPGTIQGDAIYSLPEAKARLGFGAHAMRSARRRGLRVRYVGKCAFLLGSDIIKFIDETGKDTK